jgi:penicillin-binding protein 1A
MQQTYEATMKQDLIVKNRKTIHQESYAADLVAQQVEKLVGRDSCVSDWLSDLHDDRSRIAKEAETVLREQLNAVERHEGYEHPLYADLRSAYKGPRQQTRERRQRTAAAARAWSISKAASSFSTTPPGGLLALIGGRNFQHSEYDRALVARRPVGTAFTPFVFAAGFEQGAFSGDDCAGHGHR